MTDVALAEVDRGILFALQRDARTTTIDEIATLVGVSASTGCNRIDKLEDAGLIGGYYPKINSNAATSRCTSSSSVQRPPRNAPNWRRKHSTPAAW